MNIALFLEISWTLDEYCFVFLTFFVLNHQCRPGRLMKVGVFLDGFGTTPPLIILSQTQIADHGHVQQVASIRGNDPKSTSSSPVSPVKLPLCGYFWVVPILGIIMTIAIPDIIVNWGYNWEKIS